jgi:uncharacterized protein (UPF0332 family)
VSDELAALVQYRLEQADAALNDAKYLLDGCRSPHSIVNRAYYAMFYAALAVLQKAGKIPSKHAGTIGLFDTEFVVKGAFPRELSRGLPQGFRTPPGVRLPGAPISHAREGGGNLGASNTFCSRGKGAPPCR